MADYDQNDKELLILQRSFVSNVSDRLDSIQELLLQLEKVRDSLSLQDIKRQLMSEVHSLKGTAAAYHLDLISQLAHKMEDILTELPPDAKIVSSSCISVLLKITDMISQFCTDFLSSSTPPQFNSIEDQLKQIDVIKALTEYSRSGIYKLRKSLAPLDRIIIIDDDDDMLNIYRMAFQKNKNQTALYLSESTSANQHIAYFKPDLVICDLHIPQKNGLEILCDNQNSTHHQAPFLFVTGDLDSDLAKDALQSGALAVLGKNLITPHFSGWLQEYLRHLEQNLGSQNKTA